MLQKITIENRYAITDKGTSDGTQIKYFKDNMWYKLDRYGGEGEAEELASIILKLSSYPQKKYVTYNRLLINGQSGCVSKNFLRKDEQFVTLYRLYMNITGRDLAAVTQKMDYDDAIEFVLEFVLNSTEVDLREYLADIFTLDELILNDDRHFNNLGLLFDGMSFKPAPIFDNGKSLLVGNNGHVFAKAFSGSFSLNRSYLQNHATLKPNRRAILSYLDEHENEISSRALNVLRYNLQDGRDETKDAEKAYREFLKGPETVSHEKFWDGLV